MRPPAFHRIALLLFVLAVTGGALLYVKFML